MKKKVLAAAFFQFLGKGDSLTFACFFYNGFHSIFLVSGGRGVETDAGISDGKHNKGVGGYGSSKK